MEYDDDVNLPSKFVPIIIAFRSSSNIIFDACGSKGHRASKCFKRGFNFLPRDIQRHITAYNSKYGSSSKNNSSTEPFKSYHALETPDHCTPSTTTKSFEPQDHLSIPGQIPTISSIDHILPVNDIEEIFDIESGTRIQSIKMMSDMIPNYNLHNIQDIHQLKRA